MKKIDLNGKPFHFIGIGGIGMSALAYILAKRNLPVSGSDIRASHITQRLEGIGAKIFTSQTAENLEELAKKNYSNSNLFDHTSNSNYDPQIICSTAINNHNSEYQGAIEKGYPLYHRSDLLAALIKDYQSIAVAGTHGKTTTSSLIAYMLLECGLDPTVIIGGEVKAWEGNARLGKSPYLVAEADESDGSLVKHHPQFGIITNIELDHPDHYQSLDQLINIFQEFSSQSDTIIASIDCPVVKEHIKADITYSLNPHSGANYIAQNVIHTPLGSEAEIWENGHFLGNISLLLSGDHNISNALASIALGRKLGLDFNIITEALSTFEGAKRRFEYKGTYEGATLIDDYAHHPSEIRCTLQAGRSRLPQYKAKRLVAIFQPHRYSRTSTFLEEFAQCFDQADVVIITDIYSAGETNTNGITGESLVKKIKEYHDRVYYHPELSTMTEFLTDFLQPQDLTLFLGAGNLNQIIPQLVKLNHKNLAQAA
ncbi:UDP-N-acetylmuramate--L-alanine ligase [Geminocystis sp. NIES-3709]|uniref:UDP-N-acetylmuramate--L-alanine ligase n=1 Tax=Geminocystis sp. NIES-3709 TaxID=1617448 RepID=UPI0005FCA5C5|nr:UDP-N-acetylmuramate--L-alanine ligase [Geminocystis sp. NIES-3709]BAQ64108.1 UDP-N-acetylmuramate--alanine ligase [Geminocystis sp. NIES-3709]